jgi:hypothetical protein
MISQENQTFLQHFREILAYGDKKLRSVLFYEKKYRLKKKILFLMMAGHQCFSEAILRLMEKEPIYDKPAESLFRTLAENYINLQFIYSERSQKHALIFIIVSHQEQNDFAKKFKELMKKYPSWDLEFANFKKPQDWDSFIDKNEKLIISGERKWKFKVPARFYNLQSRAQIVDNYLTERKKLKKSNSMESYYVHYYRFFSQISHLTMPGLERFLIKHPSGREQIIVDGDNESINRVIAIAYQIYYVVLRFVLKEFKIFDKSEFNKFDQYSKNLK